MDHVTWSEHMIARAIALQTLARKCVVLVDNCAWTGHECDVLAITHDLRIIDVEVKISRKDLKADAKKDKWWRAGAPFRPWAGETRPEPTPRQWPPKVWKHYYALPADIWKPELGESLPSEASGVLLLRQRRNSVTPLEVQVWRRARPNKLADKLTPAEAVDVARLANLRMWEAYRRQDAAEEEVRRMALKLKESQS